MSTELKLVGYSSEPEVWHKYSFNGELRTYRQELRLTGGGVKYLGITTQYINHWEVSIKYNEIEQFLDDTEAYVKLVEGLNEYFVYLINDEKRYYLTYKSPQSFLSEHVKRAIYLGIGRPETDVIIDAKNAPKGKKKQPKVKHIEVKGLPFKKNITNWSTYFCCYCETPLDADNYTREHLIPKDRGGTNHNWNLRECCFSCNNEKDNLMLHSYIQLLNYQLSEKTGDELLKLQIKIKNANKLAKELELISK